MSCEVLFHVSLLPSRTLARPLDTVELNQKHPTAIGLLTEFLRQFSLFPDSFRLFKAIS